MILAREELSEKSKIKGLQPFIDPSDNLLRVGGRLTLLTIDGKTSMIIADLYNIKHQIILPKQSLLTKV